MTYEHPFRICWTQQNASAIFTTEALEGDDAIFLATHTPISGFDVLGPAAADFERRDEQAVLDALSDPYRRHAFCVVQGEPGSGKSHLIRWLSVNWPQKNDVKLLLRRADGSLEGALRQLREKLPAEFHELFEGLGVRQKARHQGRANIFLSTLADMSDPEHFEDRVVDEGWCARFRPGDILGSPYVKSRWTGPSRILQILEGAGGARNSASASFDLFDMADLARIVSTVRASLPSAGAKELSKGLADDAVAIDSYREAGWAARDLATERPQEFVFASALLDVLNRRRNDAIQNVLGVSAGGLKTLFRKVRQELQNRGQRLVLLLEDITSWEGLDDSLIDVLVFNSEAAGGEEQSDVCPLISVVGLTPVYLKNLQANYNQRITHEIRLGQSTGGLQDVASLRRESSRTEFVAGYLAAVRTGVPALKAWREDLRDTPALPPPNMCNVCPKRSSCHAVFGEHGGVGLFPLTTNALNRFFDALKVDDDGQTWRTPRGILQAVLNPCLSQPELLARGEFPSSLIESGAIEGVCLPEIAVSGRIKSVIGARVRPLDQARFGRTITFWGDPEGGDAVSHDAVPLFAGLRRSLYVSNDAGNWSGGDT